MLWPATPTPPSCPSLPGTWLSSSAVQVEEWKLKFEAAERREAERREADMKKHKDEVGRTTPAPSMSQAGWLDGRGRGGACSCWLPLPARRRSHGPTGCVVRTHAHMHACVNETSGAGTDARARPSAVLPQVAYLENYARQLKSQMEALLVPAKKAAASAAPAVNA